MDQDASIATLINNEDTRDDHRQLSDDNSSDCEPEQISNNNSSSGSEPEDQIARKQRKKKASDTAAVATPTTAADNQSQVISPATRISGLQSFMRGFAMYFAFPFLSGIMLGLGEICAHELTFRWWGWQSARPVFANLIPRKKTL